MCESNQNLRNMTPLQFRVINKYDQFVVCMTKCFAANEMFHWKSGMQIKQQGDWPQK